MGTTRLQNFRRKSMLAKEVLAGVDFGDVHWNTQTIHKMYSWKDLAEREEVKTMRDSIKAEKNYEHYRNIDAATAQEAAAKFREEL